jgi:hypothetical protein
MRYRPVRIVDLPCERAARKGRGSGPGSKRRWWVQRDRSKGAATVKRAVRVDEEGEEEREREKDVKRLASSPWSREKVPTGGRGAPPVSSNWSFPCAAAAKGGWEEAGTGVSARECA